MEGVGNQRSGGSDGCLQGRVSEGGKSELVSLLQPDPVSLGKSVPGAVTGASRVGFQRMVSMNLAVLCSLTLVFGLV